MEKTHISLETLRRVERQYPSIWSAADSLQHQFSAGQHSDGCIFSLAEAHLLSHKLQRGENNTIHPALLGALVSWRPTKEIFRFHPELYESLIDTDIDGEIPSDVLRRMPGWAVFIETPISKNLPFQLEGFWAYLSTKGKQNDLILVGIFGNNEQALKMGFDPESDVFLYEVPLGNHPISDIVEMMFPKGSDMGDVLTQLNNTRAIQEHMLSSMLSLLLYLCSEQPDIDNWTPKQPTFKYMGNKRRWLASKNVHEWNVGLRLGTALKVARDRSELSQPSSETGASVRPHVRRAHWHSFWIGKKGEQSISLRWLPPIPVNIETTESLPAVLRHVAAT